MGVHLLTGDDESILRAKVHDLVAELVGDGDRGLMVEEYEGEEYELRAVVDAAQTMPFLTDRRIVVGRDVGRFTVEELTPLLRYLESPLESSELVLAGGGGRLPKKLIDAISAVSGRVIDTNPPRKASDRQAWVRAEAEQQGLRVDGPAANRIAEQLGEDVGRLDGILGVLRSTYGDGARLTTSDVDPFLGEGGGVPPWDFTDAVDAGDTSKALQLMGRMIHGGERHPLQVMAILHGHYAKLARLDGVDARSDNEAAAAMGIKPGFPARKALGNYRRLGGEGVRRAVELLATADLDLRGDTDLEPEMVMEILVARLSRLGAGRVSSRR